MPNIFGDWDINPVIDMLPQHVATAFGQLTSKLVGATYEPLMYCGSQLVSGMNYAIICKQTLATNPQQENIVKMVIYESLNKEFSINSIDAIIVSQNPPACGGWKIEVAKGKMPEEVATGFSKVMMEIVGATYEPLLYCGLQIVNGANYMIICKQTLITNPPAEHIVRCILNKT